MHKIKVSEISLKSRLSDAAPAIAIAGGCWMGLRWEYHNPQKVTDL